MDYNSCELLLNQTLQTLPSASQNIGQLMIRAWGSKRGECTQIFGDISKVSDYVKAYEQGLIPKSPIKAVPQTSSGITSPITSQTSTTQSTQETPLFSLGDSTDLLMGRMKTVGNIFLLLFVGYCLYKIIRYFMIFLYDVRNADRMVYLKVLQTRGDSKVDREASKELARDMKEKISRMSQVLNNFYVIGKSSVYESVLSGLFNKPKLTLVLQYQNGQLEFIIGTYPEYQAMIEGAISAQYSESSIEVTAKPTYFVNKYYDITVLEPQRDTVYPIRTFKTMPDDPLNNIIDAIARVDKLDTLHVILPLKPQDESYNLRAKKMANALFKKDKTAINGTPFWHYFLFPWKILQFFINGPSKELLRSGDDDKPDGMVRMVKAEEDTYQTMGEEAANHAFHTGIILISSADDLIRAEQNLDVVIGAFSIYEDQYANSLEQPHNYKYVFPFSLLYRNAWIFSLRFTLQSFFYAGNVFSVNSLASIFHFPDGVYNRSQIIRWMDYKALACPDNAPVMDPKDDTGYIMSGVVAEKFKGGKLTDILAEQSHSAIDKKVVHDDTLTPIEQYTAEQLVDKEIVEKAGKKYVKTSQAHDVYGYKINKGGILLGINIYRNKYTPVYMKREDRMRHHYLIGKSGTGKSVLLQTMARQDIWNGDGCCVIDPHGDLVEDIMEYIPKERAKDVVFFDAGNEDRPMGLNLYDINDPDQADRTVNDATEIFIKMFGSEIFGPRIQEYFKYGSLTLLEDFDDKPTLLDVPRLFTDETYRDFKTKKVKNAVVKNFREKTYASMGDREKQEIIPYFTSKFVSFNTNRLIRNIIGQTKSSIKFKEAMDNQKIILISLSKGKIGEINAQLLGMIIVSQIYNGAMARASMSKEERKDFFLYVDEFQNFVSGTFADILSEARKYRLALIMAHQYIAQLEGPKSDAGGKGDVKAAVFGNCGTIQSFKIGAPDAEFLEKEYAPVLGAQDIIGIANYKTYCKLNIDNTTSRVFSMNAIYTQDYRNKKIAAILKEYSAKKYGRKREFVDAEISARLGLSTEEVATPDQESGEGVAPSESAT